MERRYETRRIGEVERDEKGFLKRKIYYMILIELATLIRTILAKLATILLRNTELFIPFRCVYL